ncbi:MAG: TlyA family RNA methyltransferase [Leptospiraceae bacterium]|nr:TlyA family RNA methyltransferase [Leptospiraceae bacterium]
MRIEKIRLDELLVQKGLAIDLKKATSLILSRSVLINDKPVTKAGEKFPVDSKIRIREMIKEYVSRGALKLKPILEKLNIDIKDEICLDIGASTGGFTEVLLEKGAKKVYSIDVGYGQLADRIRQDGRVVVMDRLHFKEFSWSLMNDEPKKVFITSDLSFISIKILFTRLRELKEQRNDCKMDCLVLIKPQFEAKQDELVKGILVNTNVRFRILKDILKDAKRNRFILKSLNVSPIKGNSGNTEYFLYFEV